MQIYRKYIASWKSTQVPNFLNTKDSYKMGIYWQYSCYCVLPKNLKYRVATILSLKNNLYEKERVMLLLCRDCSHINKNEIKTSHIKKCVTTHDIGYLIKNKSFHSVYDNLVFVKIVTSYSVVNWISESKFILIYDKPD